MYIDKGCLLTVVDISFGPIHVAPIILYNAMNKADVDHQRLINESLST